MAATILGTGVDCAWGIAETSGVGTITDVQYEDNSISEDCETQEGAVDGVVVYDGNKTVQLTIVAKAAAVLPTKGEKLAFNSVDYLVQKVGTAKKHKGKVIVSVTAIHHDNMTL